MTNGFGHKASTTGGVQGATVAPNPNATFHGIKNNKLWNGFYPKFNN